MNFSMSYLIEFFKYDWRLKDEEPIKIGDQRKTFEPLEECSWTCKMEVPAWQVHAAEHTGRIAHEWLLISHWWCSVCRQFTGTSLLHRRRRRHHHRRRRRRHRHRRHHHRRRRHHRHRHHHLRRYHHHHPHRHRRHHHHRGHLSLYHVQSRRHSDH